jgi:hypothetical protein
VPLAPHQVHRIAICLANGVITGISTTALNNLMRFVNHSALNLADPETQPRTSVETYLSSRCFKPRRWIE